MKKRLITYPDREIWNKFVADSPTSPVLQSFEWGEFKSKFGWKPIRIAIEDQGKIVAGISILKKQIPFSGFSMFYAPRGPIVDFSNRELFECLLAAVEDEADEQRAAYLKIDPAVPEAQAVVLDNLMSLGFVKAPKQVQPRATFQLDLSRGLDEILKSFEEKTRYNVRLAEKKGVQVQENSSEKGIKLFYEMYEKTARRDKFLIHPLKYYLALKAELFERGMGKIFVAYYKGKPIASVVVFCFGSRVWYMYGASLAEHRNVMPNHLLHWQVIQWAKGRQFTTYDLWGIPANPSEGHPLWGVYRFKKGFNGQLVKYIGVYDFPYSPLFYNVFEFGVIWWQRLRSLLTKGRIEDPLSE
jgi:lipid II:glycine glycyltransferase (peptidoglycan interpeptide bridge formation enzyme)